MTRLTLAFLLLLASTAGVARANDRLASGLALLEEAARLRSNEPERAERLAADAAALIAAEVAPDNPAGQRALGNAWLLAGDLGRAVLAYRRAEAAAPHDPLVRASLGHARSRVGARVSDPASLNWRSAAAAWRSVVPRRVLFWAAAGAFGLASWAIALRVAGLLTPRITGPAAVLGVAGACGLGLLVAEPLVSRAGSAVVVAEAVGRTGPHAEVYPAALDAPLPPGTEVRILESRDGWVRCDLGGLMAWLPAERVEPVRPPA